MTATPNWLFDRFDEPRYDSAAMHALTGIAPLTLQNWAKRELLEPVAGGGGKGNARLYNKTDVVEVAFARHLMAIGIDASLAIWYAGELLGCLGKHLQSAKPHYVGYEASLNLAVGIIKAPKFGVSRTKTEFKVIDCSTLNEEAMEDLLFNEIPALTIACGSIMENIEELERELYGESGPIPRGAVAAAKREPVKKKAKR